MKKRFLSILLPALLSSLPSFSQFYPDYSQNYFTQTAYWDHYYDSVRTVRLAAGDSSMRGCGYGKYTQWKHFWKQYVGDNGSLGDALERYKTHYNEQRYDQVVSLQGPPPNASGVTVNWTEIGPVSFNNILGYNGGTWYNPHYTGTNRYQFAAHVGRFDRLFQHPTQPNTLYTYCGSPDNYSAGGLFKTTNGGTNWFILGTDKIPNAMVAGFEVKPQGVSPSTNQEIMFIALASGAMYRSIDGGASWIECEYNGNVQYPPNFGSNIPPYSIANFFDITNNPFPLTPIENKNFKLKFVYTAASQNPYSRLLVAREGGLYYSDNYDATITVSGSYINNGIIWQRFTSIDPLFTSANLPYMFPSITDHHDIAVTDVEQYTFGNTAYLVAHVSRKEMDANNYIRAIRSYIIISPNDGGSWIFLGGSSNLPNGRVQDTYLTQTNQDRLIHKEVNIEVMANGANFVYLSFGACGFSDINGCHGFVLYKYDLNGQTWSDLTITSGRQAITPVPNGFAINPANDNEYWEFMNHFYHFQNGNLVNQYDEHNGSGNYGWRRHPDTRDFLIVNSSTMYIATDGGIYKSTDAGNSFFPVSEGLGGANTGDLAVSQQPPFFVGSGFWHCGFQVYNPVENVWHFQKDMLIGDGGGGKFSFLNNQIYSCHQFDPGGQLHIMSDFNLLDVHSQGAAFAPSWNENINGLAYYIERPSNKIKRTTNNFISNNILLALPSGSPGPIGQPAASFTVPNDAGKLMVYDEQDQKLFLLQDLTTSLAFIGNSIDLTAAYQNLSGSSSICDFDRTKTIVFDPNQPSRFWIILKSQAAWNDTEDGRIAEYDPQTGFTDITYKTDDVIYGTATTVFPKHISIRDIEMDRQTGILYIGTTNGVYYLDRANEVWKKYSQNVPFLNSDLEIMHCTGEIYCSSRFRGIWKAPLLRTGVPTREWHITQNTTWTSRMNLFCTLVIDPGKTLTVKSDLVVYGFQKIIVKPGGTLIIDGGKLTTECGDWWSGIEVWGDRNQHQYAVNGAYYQGRLVINNGTIENAREAIRLHNPNDGSGGYNSSGGIVQATGGIIRNVYRGAEFLSYQNFNPTNPSQETSNESYFKNCIFETTGPLPGGTFPYTFVSLWNVKGLKFQGCTFRNTYSGYNNPNKYGRGIYTENADFLVEENCTQIGPNGCVTAVPSVFKNLWVGVWSSQAGGNRTYAVKTTTFDNCKIGMLSDGVSNMTVTNNTYILGKHPAPNPDVEVGLDLVNTITNYTVRDNQFSEAPNPTNTRTLGAWSYSTGVSDKTIRKNTFTNLYIGAEAERQNRFHSTSLIQGLDFQCNTFTGGDYDFVITNGTVFNSTYGIKRDQGSNTVPAGNKFSNNGNVPANGDYFNNSANNINYFYNTADLTQKPLNYTTTTVALLGTANTNTGCNSSGGGGSMMALMTGYLGAEEDYQGYKTLLESLIDGGNTEQLKNEVNTAGYTETMQLRATLLGQSPYLSNEVLKAAADNTTVLPEAILLEILLANPDALYSNDLLDYLQNKAVPLPEWMMELLQASRGQITLRTLLESALAHYGSLRSDYIRDILTAYETTDTLYDEAEIRGWYARYKNYQADYQVVESFAREGQFQAARDFLNTLDMAYNLEGWALADKQNYADFMEFYLTMKENGKQESQLDSGEVLLLQALADASDEYTGSMRARAILNFFYGYEYMLTPTLPEEEDKSASTGPPPYVINYEHLDIYPVPAADWVAFSYRILPNRKNLTLTVANTMGVTTYQQKLQHTTGVHVVDVSGWAPGVYAYRILSDGGKVFSGTFVVN